MPGYTRSAWQPATRMGAARIALRDEVMGVPANFLWGGAGFATALGGAVVVDAVFPEAPVPPTILGPLAASLIGALLFWNAGQPKRAVPWAVGAAIPAAVQMAYGMLFPASSV